jgi:hypothetical protein
MQPRDEHPRLLSITIDPEPLRPAIHRKHPKSMESEVMPRRADLKVTRLDQLVSGGGSANVVNLQFL